MRTAVKILIFILIIGGFACCEKPVDGLPGDIIFIPDPAAPKTTDIIHFEVSSESGTLINQKIFFRWDWESDSAWDTGFSLSASASKRFLKAGEYNVTLQYADGKGKSSNFTHTIEVIQGYSAPRASFTISPPEGNYTKEFIFDASETIDDEDSISQLVFRWDFQGDGNWDTGFDTARIVVKKYSKPGLYFPKLEVKDPSRLFGGASGRLEVSNTDTLIHVNISWSPEEVSVGDTVIFDASGSFYQTVPEIAFKTSWILPDYPLWTEPSREKEISFVFRSEGKNTVKCKIILDNSNLENTGSVEIFAARENRPPEPAFEVAIPYGNIHTQFYFDCWGTRDDHLSPTQILLRWDWESDGVWDTPFTLDKEFFHQYSEPGVYNVTLQARDDKLETSKISQQLTVSPYNNQTGFFRDSRDGNLYGTVKIGNQWWMAENLRFDIPEKTKSGLEATLCLFEQPGWCEAIGKLYHISSVTADRFDSREFDVCPNGWRIPTKNDIETLVQNLGGEYYAKELMFGGQSDFNAVYTGYASFLILTENMFPVDTVYKFNETYENFYLPSNSIAPDINEARIDIYMIRISRTDGSLWSGYFPTRFYMPVRCIKED